MEAVSLGTGRRESTASQPFLRDAFLLCFAPRFFTRAGGAAVAPFRMSGLESGGGQTPPVNEVPGIKEQVVFSLPRELVRAAVHAA